MLALVGLLLAGAEWGLQARRKQQHSATGSRARSAPRPTAASRVRCLISGAASVGGFKRGRRGALVIGSHWLLPSDIPLAPRSHSVSAAAPPPAVHPQLLRIPLQSGAAQIPGTPAATPQNPATPTPTAPTHLRLGPPKPATPTPLLPAPAATRATQGLPPRTVSAVRDAYESAAAEWLRLWKALAVLLPVALLSGSSSALWALAARAVPHGAGAHGGAHAGAHGGAHAAAGIDAALRGRAREAAFLLAPAAALSLARHRAARRAALGTGAGPAGVAGAAPPRLPLPPGAETPEAWDALSGGLFLASVCLETQTPPAPHKPLLFLSTLQTSLTHLLPPPLPPPSPSPAAQNNAGAPLSALRSRALRGGAPQTQVPSCAPLATLGRSRPGR